MVDGTAGEEIDEIVRETPRLPQGLAENIGQLMQIARCANVLEDSGKNYCVCSPAIFFCRMRL